MDTRLQAALDFAAKGWPVFPVKANKLPAIKDWENRATVDTEQIEDWFRSFPDGCNFGFPAGRAGVVVIDCDNHGEADGEASLAGFVLDSMGTLPDTFTVRTPSGGRHRYYKADGLASKNGWLPAVDIKTNGGYVVIPGSLTGKGSYIVEKPLPVSDLPEWFIDAYGRRKRDSRKPEISYNTRITPDTKDKVENAREIIDAWPEAVEGERNERLFQLMRELCKAGVSRKRAEELYAERGLDKIGLDPDSAEVIATIKSAYGDLADLGSESQEGKRLSLADLGDLPPLDDKPKFSDNGGQDWTDLAAADIPERRWFIRDWLSADPGYTVLFSGRGGTGKSALMLDLMYSLATGEPFCGMPVLRGAKVLFITCEDSNEEVARRIQQRKFDSPVPKGVLQVWARSGKSNTMYAPARNGLLQETPFVAEVRERAKQFFDNSGGVIIWDTVADFFAGNESDRSQVSQFVKTGLTRLGLDLGVTNIVLAHPSKAISTTGQGFSGSTAWEGAFRCRWELNYQKAAKVDGLRELVLAKSNTAQAGQKILLENRNGLFAVVSEATVDDSVRELLIQMIDEAYKEGAPFGRGSRSNRPIESASIQDPVTGQALTRDEIRDTVERLLADRVIESFRSRDRRGLRLLN